MALGRAVVEAANRCCETSAMAVPAVLAIVETE
jgi:hypothetical protein